VVSEVLLLGTHCWGIRPNRFRTVLDTKNKGKKQENQGTLLDQEREREIAGGIDFTGVTSKDQNPYVGLYRNLLADVGKALTDNGITWHITFGTLIGHQRVGKFLPYDSDLDIYVVGKPFEDKVKFNAMQSTIANLNKGYTFSSVGGPVYRVQKNKVPGQVLDARGRGPNGEGTWVDLYHYGSCNSQAADRLCDGFEVPKGVKLQMDKLLPTTECVIDGIKTQCPKESTYLLDTYYESWRKPKMQYCSGLWSSSCDPGELVDGKQSSSLPTKTKTIAKQADVASHHDTNSQPPPSSSTKTKTIEKQTDVASHHNTNSQPPPSSSTKTKTIKKDDDDVTDPNAQASSANYIDATPKKGSIRGNLK